MSDTRMKTRIIHKHAIESDWAKAVNFVPLKGELIVYDIDDSYNYERIKIGDGVQNVNDLPFFDDDLRSKITQADWNQGDEITPDYVKNRTHYEEIINTPNTWTFRLDNSGGWVSGTDPDFVKVISENKNITSAMVDSLEIDLIQEREGEVVEDCKYFDMSTESFDGDGVVSYVNHLYIRLFVDENGEYTGKYAIGEDGASWGTCTITANLQSYVVHHLDPKYIKDMYYESENVIATGVINSADEQAYMALVDGREYEIDKEYTIVVNGVKYITTYHKETNPQSSGIYVYCLGCAPWDITEDMPFSLQTGISGDPLRIHVLESAEYPVTVKIVDGVEVHHLDPKYIKDMYYEEENRVNIAGMVFGSDDVDFPRGVEEEHNFNIPFALGQVWNVNYGNGSCNNLEVKEAEDGTLYIGTYPDVNNTPFYITANTYKGNSSWWDQMQPDSCIITGVSGTYIDEPIVHQIDTKYLPIIEETEDIIFEMDGVMDGYEHEDPSCKKLIGQYTVIIDGISTTVDFINDGVYSFAETDSCYIETWDSGVDLEAGIYFEFITNESHSVKIVGVKDIIKEKYLPDFVLSKPDWNQNDSNVAGYIENRTHYEVNSLIVVVPNTEVQNRYTIALDNADAFTVGQKLVIAIDGTKYETTVRENVNLTINSGVNTYPIGIGSWMSADTTTQRVRVVQSVDDCPFALLLSNNELVFFYEADNATNDMHAVEVCIKNSEIHQLDEKFIPDTIARIDDIPEQEQSNWNQNDETSASYIKNRPLYFDVQPIAQNLTASGSTSGYTVITPEFIPVDGVSYYVRGVYTNDKAVTTTFDGIYECANGKIDILTWDGSGCPILNITESGINVGVSNSYRVASVVIDVIGVATYHALDEVYIPDTIARVSEVEEVKNLVGDQSVSEQINAAVAAIKPKCATITLSAASWTGDTNPWHQVVTVNGATANSKIDLQPTAVQIVELQNSDIALIAENNDGVVTVYAIGGKPTKDYTMQALITEVAVV